MIVIAMASQKGGSGKTTLSGHIAVEAERCGAGPVALIDTDPQGSLAQWWNARAAKAPHFAKVSAFDLQGALDHLRNIGFRLVVIDTPPAITLSIEQVIQHADLVVVPTRPSPHDLRAVGATMDIAERFEKPLVFVVNGATPRARITREISAALSQHGTVAPVMLHNRFDFAASMVDGRTVGEAAPKSPSAKEISELWRYLQGRLAELRPDMPLPAMASAGGAAETAAADSLEQPQQSDTVRPPEKAKLPEKAKPPEIERRVPPPDRRNPNTGAALFGGSERRSIAFGRRNFDHHEIKR